MTEPKSITTKQHWLAADGLLATIYADREDKLLDTERRMEMIAMAQVHATLSAGYQRHLAAGKS